MGIFQFLVWMAVTAVFAQWWMPSDPTFFKLFLVLAGSAFAAVLSLGLLGVIFALVAGLVSGDFDSEESKTYRNITIVVTALLATGGGAAYFYFGHDTAETTIAHSTATFSDGVVNCSEPLPRFTLGEHSNPTNKQASDLCACIWSEMETAEKSIMERAGFKGGDESKISDSEMDKITAAFHRSMLNCGGYAL